ncbi:Helix-turn-helix domain-containing protein [Arthrobacter sp. 49Tsu3.1M3]|uniref:helix-turn-helix domain-containing protein n=1 Tax=Arthrobacter sp. 49Tsu3.1M3 TaxID=1279029 RepID=UPI0009CE8599|nr:helix-turn-helix domain-containing protein [Arthrobacter sp. 49Tsu3.1M3]SKB44241.1 Helix-turn-helix domain-containing protein [Arthrobacter sp. 49Tsu3.1M3]
MTTVPSTPSRPLQYSKAIRESDLPTGVRAVCWALATYANNNTGIAYPTVATLAEATGISAPYVSKHTGFAEAKGYLRKDRRKDSSIIYTITVPIVEEPPTTEIAGTGTEMPIWDWVSQERAKLAALTSGPNTTPQDRVR